MQQYLIDNTERYHETKNQYNRITKVIAHERNYNLWMGKIVKTD